MCKYESVNALHVHNAGNYISAWLDWCACLSPCRRLLMCRVTLGKPVEQYNAIKIAHAPPGHHSVIGRPSTGGLNYPEYAIYRGEQVRPVQTRKVWPGI